MRTMSEQQIIELSRAYLVSGGMHSVVTIITVKRVLENMLDERTMFAENRLRQNLEPPLW